jgi:LPPG:FO 2-phospho-L-lactate transferase
VLPMSDQPVSTIVHSDEGLLGFQEYFVARRCEPRVSGFHFEGIEEAQPAPGVLEAIRGAELVVVCPSNPWVSIDPILALPGIRQAISGKPVAAVSPIIGGETVKGPAAKIFAEMGIQPSALAVREHYGDLLTAFVLDDIDLELNEKMSLPTLVTDTIMQTAAHRRRLAEEILAFVKNL